MDEINAYDRRMHTSSHTHHDGSVVLSTTGEGHLSSKVESHDRRKGEKRVRMPKHRPDLASTSSLDSYVLTDSGIGKRTPSFNSCVSCGATDASQWRHGPGGLLNMCNRCGLVYAKRRREWGQRNLSRGGSWS